MAKALVGHLVRVDPRRSRETWQLRQRVADLEAEVRRLKAENDALAAGYDPTALLVIKEPADLQAALR